MRRGIELERVAIRADGDRHVARGHRRRAGTSAAQVLACDVGERRHRQCKVLGQDGHLGEGQLGRCRACEQRAAFQAVRQEQRRGDQPARRLAVGHEEEFSCAKLRLSRCIGHRDAAIEYTAIESRRARRTPGAFAALVERADLQRVVRAAYADGGLRGLDLVRVLVDMADAAGERAEAAAHQPENRALTTVDAPRIRELLDTELAVRLERHQGLVGKTQLGMALRAGGHRIADIHCGACGHTLPFRASRLRDVAHREHDAARGLRHHRRRHRAGGACSGDEQQHTQRIDHTPASRSSAASGAASRQRHVRCASVNGSRSAASRPRHDGPSRTTRGWTRCGRTGSRDARSSCARTGTTRRH